MLRHERLDSPGGGARPLAAAAEGRTVSPELAAELAAYQRSLGAPPPAVRAAESLARPAAAAVVTGQQPGLLGGPLLTLAKALSAIAWAGRLAEETGRPVVPVFWVASEDHDLPEANRVGLLTAGDRVEILRLELEPDGRMLSEVDPGPGAEELLRRVEDLLPRTSFLEAALEGPRAAPRANLGEWFAGILSRWLGGKGLVVVHPRHFRRAARRVLELERARPGAIAAACAEGPLTVREPPFFRIEGGRRVRPRSASDLPADPTAVSWDVATRVLAQNAALPVAGHVVGPSELAYCRQVEPAHALLDLPAPPLLPRARLWLVEGKVERALARFGVDLSEAIEKGEEALAGRGFEPEEFDRALSGLEAAMERALRGVREEAGRVDEVLLRKAEGAEREILRAVHRLRDHARRAADRVLGTDRERARKVLAHLRPRGAPQERVLSPLPFLARHGTGLVKRLLEVVREAPDGCFAVYLSGEDRPRASEERSRAT